MKRSLAGIVSILIPVLLLLLIINFFVGVAPIENIQGLPVIMPIILCPIGGAIGFVSYRAQKDMLSLIGMISNFILFLFPILYHVIGTLLLGV
ncbi:hypothetical protein [Bacillus suaedae]|uniref:Uncharacterized protein n=1 Tax=Halalkalibacter suaedae TaxID=2822140 RepID=A0A941AMT8_9BACI|nr:hypothetical protein [Bacillus suaedae]MBP3950186.1 hypothetical protein [Bacillus suaedae]